MAITNYDTLDDHALAQAVVEGDSRAFDVLFARHKPTIYAMLMHRASCQADVDDIMQESFMKAYLNIARYNPAYDFGGWICTIAKNTSIDFDRSHRTSVLGPGVKLSIDGSSHTELRNLVTPTPEDSIIAAQHMARLESYIACLAEPYRQIFCMRFIDEYSYEEIVEALSLNLNTVKTRIHRARAMMCALISEGEENE